MLTQAFIVKPYYLKRERKKAQEKMERSSAQVVFSSYIFIHLAYI